MALRLWFQYAPSGKDTGVRKAALAGNFADRVAMVNAIGKHLSPAIRRVLD